MKALKKLAAVVLAAAVVLTMLAGCGSKYGTPEQEILKKINETRASAKTGLEPLSNDATLAKAAAALLDACAETQPVETTYGKGYKLTLTEVSDILNKATNKTSQPVINSTGYYGSISSDTFVVCPVGYNTNYYYNDFVLTRRLTINDVGGNQWSGDYAPDWVVRYNKVKVGIASRQINGELFAVVVYDVEYING